jgi:hypothetical protein
VNRPGRPWRNQDRSIRDWRLSDLDRYVFDLRGYLVFEHVLDPGTVERLRSVIDGQGLPPPDQTLERQRFGQGGRLFSWDPAFCDLLDHPLAIAVLADLIGPYVRLDHAYGIAMRPGTSGLGLHGPAEPFDSSQYYVHRMGVMRNGLLSLSWSLSDGLPGDGGFGCIPGSHRASAPLPAGAESLVVEVPQSLGSLLVFTEALTHCTIPWRGASTRQTLLYKYSPGSTAWDPSPPAPPEVVASMSARQRRFFQPPSVGGRGPTFES